MITVLFLVIRIFFMIIWKYLIIIAVDALSFIKICLTIIYFGDIIMVIKYFFVGGGLERRTEKGAFYER